MFTVRFKTT